MDCVEKEGQKSCPGILKLGFKQRAEGGESVFWPKSVILLDWSGVDLTPKSTPYAKKLVELQDSNAALDRIYTINSKSWH